MEVTLEKNGKLAGEITVKVSEADYTEKVNKELKKIGATHTIPGFRKGHVSLDQLRKRFGKEVKSDVLNHVVYEEVMNYIKENKLDLIGSPVPVEVKEINLEDKDFTFVYRVGFAPELNIKLDKSVTLPFYKIVVSDKMIEEQDKAMCERYGAQVPGEEVDSKALVKGVLSQLNADGNVDESEGSIQNPDSIIAPFLFKDEDSKALFMGKKINDKVKFNPWKASGETVAEVASMLNIDKEKAAETKGDFEMAISEIIVLKPAEHNQEYFDTVFGKDKVHNEEEYKEAVRNMIGTQLQMNSQKLFDGEASNYVMASAKNMEMPKEFLIEWLKSTSENKNQNFEELYTNLEPSFRWQLSRDKVMEMLNVTVTDEDVLNRAKAMAFQRFASYGIYNMDAKTIEETAKRLLADRNTSSQIAAELEDTKMFQAIFNAVTIDTKEVSIDEFKELVDKQNKLVESEK